MTQEGLRPIHVAEPLLPSVLVPSAVKRGPEEGSAELSATMRAKLLDFDAWSEVLKTFGRTMRVAVALTDTNGRLLGQCLNPQPVWSLIHTSVTDWGNGCPFCITKGSPCSAVLEAVRTGTIVVVHDQAGLSHVAAPLLLGKEPLGAIIAGQVFDRYPELLLLRRVAREFSISAQDLWDIAKRERPIGSALLRASSELLSALGQAFLRQRHGAILEEKLEETNDRFQWLAEGVRDYALFTLDTTGHVSSWNVGAERMLGYSHREIVGQTFSSIFPSEDIERGVPENQLRKAMQLGRAEYEGLSVRRTEEQFWANVNITALSDDGGPIQGFAIVMHDMTDRRKLAIVLEETQRERARLQEKFLSHVSHELRTPLTAIYFFTTNVLDGVFGDLNPDQRKHLALALENVNQLKEMVGDLLDITRVNSHKLTLVFQPVRLTKAIADVLSTCGTSAEAKNIRLRSDVSASLPSAWADPVRVRQILTNLIDNGIKFTPNNGHITVTCRPYAEDQDYICVSVSDSGCGIAGDNREVIFERLAQVRSGGNLSRSGLGLGLFISRELVSRHGGVIWLESEPGRGSTFYFTLRVFSLSKYCSRIFSAPTLQAGSIALIVVDVAEVEGGTQADILREIRQILARCIHAGRDVLLPSMDGEDSLALFIVACTDAEGFALMASRILTELHIFDKASQLKPLISSIALTVARGRSREEQLQELTTQIEAAIKEHLSAKVRAK